MTVAIFGACKIQILNEVPTNYFLPITFRSLLLLPSCRLPPAVCLLPTASCRPASCRPPPASCRPPPAVLPSCFLLRNSRCNVLRNNDFVSRQQLSALQRFLSGKNRSALWVTAAVCLLPPAVLLPASCFLQSASCLLPSAVCCLPTFFPRSYPIKRTVRFCCALSAAESTIRWPMRLHSGDNGPRIGWPLSRQ